MVDVIPHSNSQSGFNRGHHWKRLERRYFSYFQKIWKRVWTFWHCKINTI